MSTAQTAGNPEPVSEDLLVHDDVSPWDIIERILRPVASLKLTIVLLVLSIFIVLAGTMAQWQTPTWQAVDDYFRIRCTSVGDFLSTSFVWIPLQIFFPPTFFPNLPEIPGGFPFPKGWLIGFALAANLLAAHGLRFRVLARGSRLIWGVLFSVAGIMALVFVVASGSNSNGFQGMPEEFWPRLWPMLLAGVTAATVICAVMGLLLAMGQRRRVEGFLVILLALVCSFFATWLWYRYLVHDSRLSDSSMRILWQLAKATGASVVLGIGCFLLFKKRGGVVLLHAGVMLLMFGELLVGLSAREGQMRIMEGQTVNFTYDPHRTELAIVDRSSDDHDTVVSIPKSVLLNGTDKNKGSQFGQIKHDDLPFDMEVLEFFENSVIRDATTADTATNRADQGIGLTLIAEKQDEVSGTDSSGAVDVPSAYVQLTTKQGKPIGTYLFSQWVSYQDMAEAVTVDGKNYDVYLRFKQDYKPYAVHLQDLIKEDYPGTTTPRDYRSIVRLEDKGNDVDRKVHIWMNNPMRYAGETFYQSNYAVDPRTRNEVTTLSVVTNMGWMIPYAACMVVAVGMLSHFVVVLLRFLHRKSTYDLIESWGPFGQSTVAFLGGGDAEGGAAKGGAAKPTRPSKLVTPRLAESPLERAMAIWLPIVLVLLVGGWLLSKSVPPRTPEKEMDLVAFGKLPIVYQGRTKPVDTLARNSLRIISERETFKVGKNRKGERQPAVRWLLDLIARPRQASNHEIFRIQNNELLSSLNLMPRKGHWYSAKEILKEYDELHKQANLARKVGDMSKLDPYQRAVLDLEQKLGTMDLLVQSYDLPRIRPEHVRDDMLDAIRRQQMLLQRQPPLAIPPVSADEDAKSDDGKDESEEGKAESKGGKWQCYAVAWTRDVLAGSFENAEPNPATETMSHLLAAYAKDDVEEFNKQVKKFRLLLDSNTAADVHLAKTDFESYFNHFHPFFYSSWAYLVAFVVALVGWLGWMRPFNRAAFCVIAVTFLVHSFALIARMYISGRPPVTNLYSSAVFIGWGCVILGMLLEAVFRIGVGNIVASMAGFLTLQIAYRLGGDGDTFVVLQAVLDTQFWLATHVVLITLGYSATFVAGALGLLYVIKGLITTNLTLKEGKDLSRMIYGILCFAIFFSFVGTVLGGLWADDSWGRFWGWDPKENGALIIVLWNAVVLHARWGGIVKERGMAVLAIIGNICTSWSWFGVNELQAGLHSYGFTKGALFALLMFVGFNVIVMALGCIPLRMWLSSRDEVDLTAAGPGGAA